MKSNSKSISIAEYKAIINKQQQVRDKKKKKYGNIQTNMDDLTFDSEKEKNRYYELKIMQRRGEISDLKLQVEFTIVKKREGVVSSKNKDRKYIADFTYTISKTGQFIVEDVKSDATKKKPPLHP